MVKAHVSVEEFPGGHIKVTAEATDYYGVDDDTVYQFVVNLVPIDANIQARKFKKNNMTSGYIHTISIGPDGAIKLAEAIIAKYKPHDIAGYYLVKKP